MNRHFSVVNKRGLSTIGILTAFSIILFSFSLAKRISSGSMLWTIPVVIAIIIFILTLMFLVGVITAGVDELLKKTGKTREDITGMLMGLAGIDHQYQHDAMCEELTKRSGIG